MNMYDFVFALQPNITGDGLSAILEKIKSKISSNGEIVKFDEWGLKTLAYPVKDYTEAQYYLIQFNSLPDKISELKRDFKINEDILRYIIVKLDKDYSKRYEIKNRRRKDEDGAEGRDESREEVNG